jgi:hypothetical protein
MNSDRSLTFANGEATGHVGDVDYRTSVIKTARQSTKHTGLCGPALMGLLGGLHKIVNEKKIASRP